MRTVSIEGQFSPYGAAPSGLIRVGEITQGKPWAKLFWPFGPLVFYAISCQHADDPENESNLPKLVAIFLS
jgi:hypothetical protein